MTDRTGSEPHVDRLDIRSLDVEEARVLARRVVFWRGIAGLLLLGILLAFIVFAQRRMAMRDRCRASLEHYAQAAADKTADPHSEILMLRWQSLATDDMSFPPTHYVLMMPNWTAPSLGSESVPLAVCNSPHGLLYETGRHVLYHIGTHWRVEWVNEKQAGELAAQAQRSERALLIHHR